MDVEPEHLYPLVKGADLRKPPPARSRRAVIVTQERIGQETSSLQSRAPRLWAYLRGTRALRGPEIVDLPGQPRFALFGIGPYSFAPYKVAVSGLHRPAWFQALGPVEGRPVMVDDTSYLLPCQTAAEAAVLMALCNDPVTLELIRRDELPRRQAPGDERTVATDRPVGDSDAGGSAGARRVHAGAVLVEHLGITSDEIAEIPAEIERLRGNFKTMSRDERDPRGRDHGFRTDQLP